MFFATRVATNVALDSRTAPHTANLNLCHGLISTSSRLPATCHRPLLRRSTAPALNDAASTQILNNGGIVLRS